MSGDRVSEVYHGELFSRAVQEDLRNRIINLRDGWVVEE